jgi:hypothetical protein
MNRRRVKVLSIAFPPFVASAASGPGKQFARVTLPKPLR